MVVVIVSDPDAVDAADFTFFLHSLQLRQGLVVSRVDQKRGSSSGENHSRISNGKNVWRQLGLFCHGHDVHGPFYRARSDAIIHITPVPAQSVRFEVALEKGLQTPD